MTRCPREQAQERAEATAAAGPAPHNLLHPMAAFQWLRRWRSSRLTTPFPGGFRVVFMFEARASSMPGCGSDGPRLETIRTHGMGLGDIPH
jgi:hypothetical protein